MPRKLPKNLRCKILGNLEISKKSQNAIELLSHRPEPSPPTPEMKTPPALVKVSQTRRIEPRSEYISNTPRMTVPGNISPRLTQWTQTPPRRLQDAIKGSRRLKSKQDVVTTPYRRCLIYDVFKTPDLRHPEDVRPTTP